METVLIIVAMLLLTGIGMRLIHLLNAQHDARIAAYHFSDALPGVGRRSRKHRPGAHTKPRR
ncbi:hypothetical protein ACWGJT_25795 [Streptomyces xantholiticus]